MGGERKRLRWEREKEREIGWGGGGGGADGEEREIDRVVAEGGWRELDLVNFILQGSYFTFRQTSLTLTTSPCYATDRFTTLTRQRERERVRQRQREGEWRGGGGGGQTERQRQRSRAMLRREDKLC